MIQQGDRSTKNWSGPHPLRQHARSTKAFLLGVFLLLPLLLSAQDSPTTEMASPGVPQEPVALRSFVVMVADSIATSWAPSLVYALGKLDRVREIYLWPEPVPQDASPEIIAAALRWASLKDMGFVLYVSRKAPGIDESEGVSPNGSIDIHYRVFRVLSAQEIMAASFTADLPTEEELRGTFWLPLVAAMDTLEAQRRAGRLTIQGLPKGKVYGFTKHPVQLDNSGEATIPLEIPGTYRYRVETPGYEGHNGVLTLLDSPSILRLEQVPLKRWTLELGALMGQFGDFWVQRRLGDRFWVGLGMEQYWIGIYYPNQEDLWPYTQPVISLPLLEPGIQAGYFFVDDSHFMKPYLSAQAQLRLNTSLLMLDPAAFMVLGSQAGLEYRVWPTISPFVELGFRFYPFCNGLYLAISRGGEVRAPSTFLFSDSWYLDVPIFRLGVRFSL